MKMLVDSELIERFTKPLRADKFVEALGELRALLAQPSRQQGVPDVDDLANFIRYTDGNHKMGASALAERICDWLANTPAPVRADPAQQQEPVALLEVIDRHEGPYNFHGIKLMDSGRHDLYTHPAPADTRLVEALEEIRPLCEDRTARAMIDAALAAHKGEPT
jgi:hypothetical protein